MLLLASKISRKIIVGLSWVFVFDWLFIALDRLKAPIVASIEFLST